MVYAPLVATESDEVNEDDPRNVDVWNDGTKAQAQYAGRERNRATFMVLVQSSFSTLNEQMEERDSAEKQPPPRLKATIVA